MEKLGCATQYASRLVGMLNHRVEKSVVGRHFKLAKRGSSFTREVRAGTATFLTMAYILAANASILSQSGGACDASDCTCPADASTSNATRTGCPASFDAGCKFFPVNAGYAACVDRTRQDLLVATAASIVVASSVMGVWANLPLALAPGMGMNAYFTYNLVGYHGSGHLPYRAALTAVFLEGALFLAIAAVGLRSRLARLIPPPLRLATPAGIGLFLASIGLQSSTTGLGLVGFNPSTLLSIAACPASSLAPLAPVSALPNGTLVLLPGATASSTTACMGRRMESPTFWLGAAGFLVIAYALKRRVNGGIIYGILFVTLLSWIRSTPFTIFPHTPSGDHAFRYFSKVVSIQGIHTTAGKLTFSYLASPHFWEALLTFLYIDLLDTTAGMYALAKLAGFVNEEDGNFEGQYFAFMSDGVGIMVGAALGTSSVTVYGESSAGIREGGKTGLTALTVAFYFLIAQFFTPLLSSIPPWAVGPALVTVGVLLMRPVMEIRWEEIGEAVPAFITIILMPLTYSVSYGLLMGIGVYIIIHTPQWLASYLSTARVLLQQQQQQRCPTALHQGCASERGGGAAAAAAAAAELQIVVKQHRHDGGGGGGGGGQDTPPPQPSSRLPFGLKS